MFGFSDTIQDKQAKFLSAQMVLGVVTFLEFDEDGDFVGLYGVRDISTGVVFRAVASSLPNTTVRYSRGDMVIVAITPPPSGGDWGGVILGRVDFTDYPEQLKFPSPSVPEEGDVVHISRTTGAGFRTRSDGTAEVYGRITGTTGFVKTGVGGRNILEIVYTSGLSVLRWTLENLFELVVKIFSVSARTISLVGKRIGIVGRGSVVISHSSKRFVSMSDDGTDIVDTEKKVSIVGKDGVVLTASQDNTLHPAARADKTAEHLDRIYNKLNNDLFPKLSAVGVVVTPFTPTETDTSNVNSESVEVD